MLFTVAMKSDKDFKRCYNKGRYVVNDAVTVYYFPNKMSINRLGLTTSKKLGNAVVRNRARRIIKAAYRVTEEKFPIGYDFVFVARSNIVEKKSTDIERFILKKVICQTNKPFEKKNSKKKV